jgi:hypothetical protein
VLDDQTGQLVAADPAAMAAAIAAIASANAPEVTIIFYLSTIGCYDFCFIAMARCPSSNKK